MILAEDTTIPTFYAYFRGFMALFLGFSLKAFVFSFVAVPAKWIRTSRQYVQNIYTYNIIMLTQMYSRLILDNTYNLWV